MTNPMKQVAKAVLITSLLTGSLGNITLADETSSYEYYEKALKAFEQQDYSTSYIHLKNSLKETNDYLPAKILMGKVLISNGYLEEAETEFLEALQAGGDPNLIVEFLGQTWLFLNKIDEIQNARFNNLSPQNQLSWGLIRGNAYVNNGDFDKAQELYTNLARQFPGDTRTLIALASMNARRNNTEAALKYALDVLALEPENVNAMRIKGEMLSRLGRIDEATTELEKAYTNAPDHPIILRSLVSLYIKRNDREKAQEIMTKVIEQTPDDPMAQLIDAWLNSNHRDSNTISTALEQINSNISGLSDQELAQRPEFFYIAALSAIARGEHEQARSYLSQYLNFNSQDLNAVKLLADTFITLGDSKQAMQLLERYQTSFSNDFNAQLLLGSVYLEANKVFKTVEILETLKRQYPDNSQVELLEIKTLIARNKIAEAMQRLDTSAQTSSNIQFILTKAMLLLQQDRYAEAMNVADALLEQAPENIDLVNFKAAILIKMQNWNEAEKWIDKALTIQPSHFSASYNKASILASRGNAPEALTLLLPLLERQSKNEKLLLLLSRVQLDLGMLTEAETNLNNVVETSDNKQIAQELLIQVYIRMKELEKAQRLANELHKLNPDDPRHSIQKAYLYLMRGEIEWAEKELQTIEALSADNARASFELSQLYLRTNQPEQAQKAIERALKLAPGNRFLTIEYVKLYLQTKRFEEASIKLEQLLESNPKDTELLILKGDIAAAQGKAEAAIQHYYSALESAPGHRLVIAKLYQFAVNGTGRDAFEETARAYLDANSDDVFFRNLIADFYLTTGKHDEAKGHYERLAELPNVPNKAFIYNNLANIYIDTDLAKARDFINQAVELNASDASILDTKGWLETLSGNLEQGLETIRRAYAMDSNNPSILYHLAYTLIKMGRTAEARGPLNLAVQHAEAFPEKGDARKLLESI